MITSTHSTDFVRFESEDQRPGALLVGLGLAAIWFGVMSFGLVDILPRGVLRMVDGTIDEANAVLVIVLGLIAMAAGVVLVLAYNLVTPGLAIGEQSLTLHQRSGDRAITWKDITSIERHASFLVLNGRVTGGLFTRASLSIPLDRLERASAEIELMIARRRPDLFELSSSAAAA